MNGVPTISKNDQDILEMMINPGLPFGSPEVKNIDDGDDQFDPIKLTEAKRLEKLGVQKCEEEKLNEAVKYFDEAVAILPTRASGYNNRAQVKRLQDDITGALGDLDKAIELSGGKGKVAGLALTQRGLIYKLQGKKEEALNDFKLAADQGNPFAKKEVVTLNPYAALCNQMLSKAFKDLQTGQQN